MFYCHWEGQPQPGLERERDRGKKGGIEKQGSLHLKNYIVFFILFYCARRCTFSDSNVSHVTQLDLIFCGRINSMENLLV
jgi:hypothetical protein